MLRLPYSSLRLGQRLKEGHGQLSRRKCGQREGKGSPRGCRERNERGKCPLASQLKFLPNLSPPPPPQETGGTVSHRKVKGEAGEQERGHIRGPHPLSPGQLALSDHSFPSVLSRLPGGRGSGGRPLKDSQAEACRVLLGWATR